MYGNAQSYTTPNGMVAESELRWAIAEAAKQARIDARTEPTNEDWGDLVCAVEFTDPQEQAEWLEWYEDDSEINQATMIDYVSTEFNRLWTKLTDKARAAFDEFEIDFVI